MTKIVFTVTNDLTYDQRMIRVCTSLTEAGFECLLIGRKLPTSRPLQAMSYQQKRLKCWFHRGKLFYLEYNFRLFWLLLLCATEGICSIDADTAMPGLWVAKIRHKKHIFDAHELFTDVPEVVHRKRVRRVWEYVQKNAFVKTDLAITVGTAIADHFRTLYGKNVAVVRNAPLLSKKLPYQPDSDRFILYQGALNKGRGLEMAIEAMQQIPCKLVLAGEGDLSAELRNMVKEKRLEHKVQFLGFVQPEALKLLTSKAYMGLNVSENAGLSYYLSLNNKFFDYIHAGLPSLINPFPEYVELNNEFDIGVITQPVVSDIVSQANLLLSDTALHQKLSSNCNIAAQKLNWETESKHLVDLYQQLFAK